MPSHNPVSLFFFDSCDSHGDEPGGIRNDFSRHHGGSKIFRDVGGGCELSGSGKEVCSVEAAQYVEYLL